MEILGGFIRKHKKIKGISINNKEYHISQYADDTDFILDGRNINYDKSEVIWIGSCRNSSVRYLQNLKLKWNPRYFKALGIIFNTNIGEMTRLNFNPKLF